MRWGAAFCSLDGDMFPPLLKIVVNNLQALVLHALLEFEFHFLAHDGLRLRAAHFALASAGDDTVDVGVVDFGSLPAHGWKWQQIKDRVGLKIIIAEGQPDELCV